MKKLKWILLFIMFLLAAIFLFATCKKTKALENVLYSYEIDMSVDTNNSIVINGNVPEISINSSEIISIVNLGTTNLFDIYISRISDNYYRIQLNHQNSSGIFSQNFNKDFQGFSIIIGEYRNSQNGTELFMSLILWGNNISNNVVYLDKVVYYYFFDNLQGQEYNDLLTRYINSFVRYRVYPRGNSKFTSNINLFTYDLLDYDPNIYDTPSEIVGEVIGDIQPYFSNIIPSTFYNAGYTAGYQAGYDDGYAAGQTFGYNSGYQVGYQDGLADNTTAYNHGYDDGYADGYRTGYDLGKTDGDAIGYQRGLAEGMAGATPVSQTVGVVSSIFAGIGTVLSIQLFPGFPLGLLILVPLFFAVLGLILWIWRRN